ncbi:MAG: mobile mystery protein B [Devosia sp.]
MNGLFDQPEGATPLGLIEAAGLLQTWIVTREELNAAEQTNILAGLDWARRRRRRDYLTEAFVQQLHKAMFGDVWRWAGTLRTREVNIGVPPHLIRQHLRVALDDVRYWTEHQTYEVYETAARLHHRLVSVHPFPNGNGGHTRLMADLLVQQLGAEPFTWGRHDLGNAGETRTRYIASLKRADDHDLAPLLAFARS